MCCHVKFGSSASKGVCINRMEHPKLGSAGAPPTYGIAWLTLYLYTPPHTRVTLPNLLVLCHTVRALLRRSAGKFDPSRPISRPLKVIGADTDRSATYDFLLTFHSNQVSISYRFRDKWRFQSNFAQFPHPRVFCAPARGVPVELGTGA